ncbi:MAG: phosphatidate cytidylyltransferase [Gemmatimonadetes bacterium]|nr:phosphatidate cytidylyltransferase [Gemmatimonadota bacterium]
MLLAAWVGGTPFLILVAGMIALGVREYSRLALPGLAAPALLLLVAGFAAATLRYLAPGGSTWPGLLVTAALLGALAIGLSAPEPREGLRRASLTLLGALYVGWLFAYLIGLRELPRDLPGLAYRDGFALVATAFGLTWASDIGAYFTGRAWGRRRLLPRISPGKTVAGAAGGAACTALVGALLFGWAPGPLPRLGPVAGLATGLGASVLAQTGDLAESLLKRAFEAKDSSRLIPGHGGILDRFDSLLFTAPAAYAFFRAVLA